MTTALPSGAPLPGVTDPGPRHLRLVPERLPGGRETAGAEPLVGYLVFVPEGTDPARLLVEGGPRPVVHPLTPVPAAPGTDGPATGSASGSAAGADAEDAAGPEAGGAARPEAGGGAEEEPGIRVDTVRRVAEVDGRVLDLTYLEFELLAHLVAHPDRVLSRETLIGSVWGYGHVGDGRTVDVHIARVRAKLGRAHRHRIVTVRRIGYKYTPGRRPCSGAAARGQS
ncbi:winged helix-turn-helix domain-containing protein [Streptomyces sp. CRN 30]|uniref:winged helix-turn-helix domain-containing protein n=1 Tax=Streptomyces sp. CRN 30 TaxID=3075613 RepID=UPI002A83D82B|nr:winged helix-turn-helix domain-containing protein [Streptomyces sp. CRN 30]